MTATQDFPDIGLRTRPLSAVRSRTVATQYPNKCVGPACARWVLVVPLAGPLNKRGANCANPWRTAWTRLDPFR